MQTAECRVETGAARESGQVAAGEPLGPTPLRAFVRGECANTQPDDGCLFRADGCLVVRGRRCRYFEASVLPLLTRCASARCLKLYPDAVGGYLKLHPELNGTLVSEPTRSCPSCGAPLRKRRRYCDACSRVRDKDNKKRWAAARRDPRRKLIGKTTQIPSETHGGFGPSAEIRGNPVKERLWRQLTFYTRAAARPGARSTFDESSAHVPCRTGSAKSDAWPALAGERSHNSGVPASAVTASSSAARFRSQHASAAAF